MAAQSWTGVAGTAFIMSCMKCRTLTLVLGLLLVFACLQYVTVGKLKAFQGKGKHKYPDRKDQRLRNHRNFTEAHGLEPLHVNFDVNCPKIIAGNETEIRRADKLRYATRIRSGQSFKFLASDGAVVHWTQNCELFKSTRKYPNHPTSDEEATFPIAYILLVHKKSAQVERLLKAIYQPQNIYCIHPDNRSSKNFKSAIAGLAGCFPNVFVASRLEKVHYAGFSRLMADINCMRDLTSPKTLGYPWRYVINLCGEDFPLKSNLEIVRKLKSFNGRNDIEVEDVPEYKKRRTRYHFVVESSGRITKTKALKKPAPHNLTVYAGLAYYIASREFVDFVLTNQTAKDLLEWTSDTYSPDENYWVTLQAARGTPGGGRWKPSGGHVVRFIRWRGPSSLPRCRGLTRRAVCIFGLGYVQYLVKQPQLFANKFENKFDPVAMQCLEEYLENKYSPSVKISSR